MSLTSVSDEMETAALKRKLDEVNIQALVAQDMRLQSERNLVYRFRQLSQTGRKHTIELIAINGRMCIIVDGGKVEDLGPMLT